MLGKISRSFERSLELYVKDRLAGKDEIDYSRLFITHCMCSDQVIQKVKETVVKYANFDEIIVTEAGCTITSHCGPDTLGILYKRKSRKQL